MNAEAKDAVKFAALFDLKTRGVTANQIQAIAEKYMKDHPQYRHQSMAQLFLYAVGLAK